MSLHRRARLSALLAAAAVALATLVPAFPAAADDQPPAPEVTASADPTADPTAEPATDPTTAPDSEPSAAPADPAPADPAPASATTASLTGAFEDLADDGDVTPLPKGQRLFHATDVGYLLIADAPAGTAPVTITVQLPDGVAAGDTQGLVDASISHPLTLVSVRSAQKLAAMVNQTSNTAATHKIYAVLVTPNNVGGVAAANQTPEKVATAVAHANDYWSQQSSGSIHFALAGTTSWYASANSCTTQAGSTALWNQAAGVAATQLGYADAPNTHLVLFFPSNTNCSGALGLGSVGISVNAGGHAWVIGTDAPIEQATSAHELGHNLSLGHADWLQCASATPSPGFDGTNGCTVQNYGDLTDVMGYGQGGISGGALSAPQAIRSSIWPSSAFTFAPKGNTTYALKPVSGNSGLRSVVVEDNQGLTYFVEFRNYTGEDDRPGTSPAGAYCTSTAPASPACITDRPGVRIMRLSQEDPYKGAPGNDSYLIGRTVNGVDRIDYLKNESFSRNGITIKVTGLSASGATVTVARNFTAGYLDGAELYPGVVYGYDDLRVGDTWGVMLGAAFIADSEKFQWYRNGSAISGATRQFYTMTNADYGKRITVKLTVASKGFISASGGFSFDDIGFGNVQKAVSTGSGTVTVSAPGSTPLKATPAGFPWGTTFTYQWYRDSAKITGATASTYTPVATDAGHQVAVTVTPTSAGNALLPVTSLGYDYRLDTDGSVFGITGTEKVGNVLSAPIVGYQSSTGSPVSVTRAFQWYRSGVAITGAIGATYSLVGADAAKTIAVRVTATAPGYITKVITTSPTGAIAAGKIQGSLVGPDLTKTGTTTKTIKLTAKLPVGSVTEPGVTYAYQWFRSVPAGTPEVAITGATASSYTLTTADYNKLVFVHVVVKKTGYGTETLDSGHLNYSVTASDTPVITGTARVGEYLSANNLTYGVVGPASTPVYTWYANGVAVQTSAALDYLVKPADYAKKITVRVTAANPGYLTLSMLSAPTGAVVKGVFLGTLDATVSQNGRVLSVAPAGLVPAPVYVYQWLRDGAAISTATKSAYTLTSLDYGKAITVKITATRSNYGSVPLTPPAKVYSVMSSGRPVITGELRLGLPLSVTLPTYSVDGSTVTPTALAYQWYRNGVAITGKTAATYTPVTADLGRSLTVKVTASYVDGVINMLPAVQTSGGTQKVGKLTLAGWDVNPTITVGHVGRVLSVASDATGISEPGTTKTYQWYRNGVAIVGGTKSSFTLTSADTSKLINVRVTTGKANYTTIVKWSAGTNYTVTADIPASIDLQGGNARVGETIAATTGAFSTGSTVVAVNIAYTWYRNGVAITGLPSTADTYTLISADLGKKITVKLVISYNGSTEWLPLTQTAGPTPTVTPAIP